VAIFGIDIGGTKCSVVIADDSGKIQSSIRFPTTNVTDTLSTIYSSIEKLASGSPSDAQKIFGISCGGPLDSNTGVVLSPPNLPGWDEIHITQELISRFGGQAFLMNDANAGALAEWIYGAGKGYQSLVFLTCGTGMGAGVILDGRLYEGTSGMAGEIGHVRLATDGPIGYGKAGSFEGFCSGGGIARLAIGRIHTMGHSLIGYNGAIENITAKDIAVAALAGDAFAKEIFDIAGHYLGIGLSILIDILNPQVIVLGSLYVRCRNLLDPAMMASLTKETLPPSLADCNIVPASLGEQIGDYAAISVALYKKS
jgi:glucokinase